MLWAKNILRKQIATRTIIGTNNNCFVFLWIFKYLAINTDKFAVYEVLESCVFLKKASRTNVSINRKKNKGKGKFFQNKQKQWNCGVEVTLYEKKTHKGHFRENRKYIIVWFPQSWGKPQYMEQTNEEYLVKATRSETGTGCKSS